MNNVGVGYQYPEYFDAVSVEDMENMINVNTLSLVKVKNWPVLLFNQMF